MRHRYRDHLIEDCYVCGAGLFARCHKFKRPVKKPCKLVDLCLRCGAQTRACACGGPHLRGGARYDRKGRRRKMTQSTLFGI